MSLPSLNKIVFLPRFLILDIQTVVIPVSFSVAAKSILCLLLSPVQSQEELHFQDRDCQQLILSVS